VIQGQLVVINKKTLQVKFSNANGKEVSFNIKESELSAPLLEKKAKKLAELDQLEVDLEEVGGQPKKITEKGIPWELPKIQSATDSTRKTYSDKGKKDSTREFRPREKTSIDQTSEKPKKNEKILPAPARSGKVLPPPKRIAIGTEKQPEETVLEQTVELEPLTNETTLDQIEEPKILEQESI
jgi:hypothetical protein